MKNFNRKIILILLLLFLVPTIVNANPIITDNFTDGDYTSNPTWNVTAGSFSVVAQQLIDTAFPARSEIRTTVTDWNISQDFNARATFNATNISSTGYLHFVKFNGTDKTGYGLSLAFNGANNYKLIRFEGSTQTVLSQVTQAVSAGTNYTVGVQRKNDIISLMFNGVALTTATDYNYLTMNSIDVNWNPGATDNVTDNVFVDVNNPFTFIVRDEETTSPISNPTIYINDVNWTADSLGRFDINNSVIFPVAIQISKTGYSTRTFHFDSNNSLQQHTDFGLRTENETKDIDFAFYAPDEITLLSNQMIEVKKNGLISARSKTDSSGKVQLNLASQDSGYTINIYSNGSDTSIQYTYSAIGVSVNRPIDEQTNVSIPGGFDIDVGGLGLQKYTNNSTFPFTSIVILGNTVDVYSFRIVDNNSSGQLYFPRTYILQENGSTSSVTLSPYLIKLVDGISVNFIVKNISDERTLPNIRITAEAITNGLTIVEDQITNAVGTATFTLISKKEYPIIVTSPNLDINYFEGTITASHDSFTFWINYDSRNNFGGNNPDVNVSFTPVAQYIQSQTQIVNAIVSANFPISSIALYGLDNNSIIDFNTISTSPYSINIDLNVLEYDNNVANIRLDIVPTNDNNISFYQTYYFGIPKIDVIEQLRLLKNNFSITSILVLVVIILFAGIILLGSSVFGNNDSQLFVVAIIAGVLWLIFFQEYSRIFIVACIIGFFAWLWTRSVK